MDYKYIEQLLERYWLCETSREEEQILRSFFRQKELPGHLCRYKSLFAYQDSEKTLGLGEDFDYKILAKVERSVVKAKRLSVSTRLLPLFKAAAMIILLLTVGGVVKHAVETEQGGIVYVYDQFENKSVDSQVAYEADSLKAPLKMQEKSCVEN